MCLLIATQDVRQKSNILFSKKIRKVALSEHSKTRGRGIVLSTMEIIERFSKRDVTSKTT